MSVTEERLRDSLSAVREIVTADDVPDLEFPARRSAHRWLVPVGAAAAAAVVVVGGTVALQQRHVVHRPSAVKPAEPRLPPAVAPPKFYLAAVAPGPIAVYDTATGRRTGTTQISGITKVAATGDGRTFFAASDEGGSEPGQAVYRITINGRGNVTATTRLSVRLPAEESVEALSASRNGSKLAFALLSSHPAPGERPGSLATIGEILVADLSKNTTATWQSARPGDIRSVAMDSAGRTLIFDWAMDGPAITRSQIRALDLALPGRDLMASRVVLTSSRSGTVMGPVALSPDGRYFAAAIRMPSPQATTNVIEYATDTGRRVQVVSKGFRGHSEYWVIAFDPTGTNLLVWGGGHRISRVANGPVVTPLAAPTAFNVESTAAW